MPLDKEIISNQIKIVKKRLCYGKLSSQILNIAVSKKFEKYLRYSFHTKHFFSNQNLGFD